MVKDGNGKKHVEGGGRWGKQTPLWTMLQDQNYINGIIWPN